MEDTSKMTCRTCGHVGLADGSDGYFYCLQCGSQADDIMDTGVADEDFVDKGGDARGALYQPIHTRRSQQPVTQAQLVSQLDSRNSQFWSQLTQQTNTTTFDHDQHHHQIKREEETCDAVGPTDPTDFGSGGSAEMGLAYEDYYNEVRNRYVMGVQLIVQFQCEALVEKFKVSPLICGIVGPIWLRFVASSGVFDGGWADEALQDSELQTQGEAEEDAKRQIRHKAEPHNLHGQRAVMVWVKALRKSIPLSCSLAVSFLACHIAREAILPTDILKWSLEGKLPYFSVFVDIARQLGERSRACPVSASVMFKPSQVVSSQKLESLAASIAQTIGLSLLPVNFYEIASRYLKQLSLPIDKILPHACRIYEWSMPPDFYLSTNEVKLPTRVCVMSLLIVTIRILYNIHGLGAWERSLSTHTVSSSASDEEGRMGPICSSDMKDDAKEGSGSPFRNVDDLDTESVRNSSHVLKSDSDAEELLKHLEAKYNDIVDACEYSKDLKAYLQFCKDVVFAGLELSSLDNEYKTVEDLWNFYQNEKLQDFEPPEDLEDGNAFSRKRSRDVSISERSMQNEKFRDKGCHTSPSIDNENSQGVNCSQQNDDGVCSSGSSQGYQTSEPDDQTSVETSKDRAIRRMKIDMEENRFCYIPPRVNLKRFDYLHYVRKRDEGALTYVAHADYYILLRACAKVAQVDIRIMHVGVLSFERRLAWLENRIDHCLHLTPPNFTCEFCSDVPKGSEDVADDTIGLSNLNL